MSDSSDITPNVTLYDDAGNPVAVVLDGSIYRLAGTNILTDAGGGKIVTVTTDGAKERLDVSSKDASAVFAQQGILFTTVLDEYTIPTGNQEDIFIIKNPVSSGIELHIEEYIFVTAKTAQSLLINIYQNPTVTADGTAMAEINKNWASATVANAACFYDPTISDRGVLFQTLGVSGGGEIRHTEKFSTNLDEGDILLITMEAGSANQDVSMDVTWAEVSL